MDIKIDLKTYKDLLEFLKKQNELIIKRKKPHG